MKLYVFSSRTLIMALMMVILAPSASYSLVALPQQRVITGAQSYREWKNSKITETKLKINLIKEKIKEDPNLSLKNNGTEAGLGAGLTQELEQEILNLAITQDLTISDYFVGYLTKQNSLDIAIKDISTRLTSEEVAELMSAYAEHFNQTRPNTLKATSRADSDK